MCELHSKKISNLKNWPDNSQIKTWQFQFKSLPLPNYSTLKHKILSQSNTHTDTFSQKIWSLYVVCEPHRKKKFFEKKHFIWEMSNQNLTFFTKVFAIPKLFNIKEQNFVTIRHTYRHILTKILKSLCCVWTSQKKKVFEKKRFHLRIVKSKSDFLHQSLCHCQTIQHLSTKLSDNQTHT